jgi:hypothetical protein
VLDVDVINQIVIEQAITHNAKWVKPIGRRLIQCRETDFPL